ncbi:MAG TPA: S9 family peptidase [Verrucomicrobiota bacterium]|nr:S9 family peptidase [Verrucomicrobiales bacterium]HRI11646.1 S9 family peptidase [Verrucomicrobiota bacterium]
MRSSLPLLVLTATALVAAEQKPMSFADLLACQRLSEPTPSPDGRWIAYTVGVADWDENRINTDVWRVPSGGGSARRLTTGPKHDRHPAWSPDGRWIAFESNRDGEFQIYVIPADGGEARPLTSISSGATQPIWSPDGSNLAFVSAVFPEFSDKPFAEADKLNQERNDAREKGKVKARVITQLLYRHWDSWVDGKRQHIFVVPMKDGAAAGSPRNLTPGDRDAVPTSTTFAAGDEFAFSPDGKEIAYTATPTPTREEAWKTDHDLWAVEIATGTRRQLTKNPAADGCPRYSPDGRWLAYRAQARPGFEADRWQLMMLNRATGEARSLTSAWDFSVEGITWTPDSRALVLEAESQATKLLWRIGLEGSTPLPITSGGAATEPGALSDGATIIFARSAMNAPAELFRVPLAGGSTQPVTDANGPLLAGIKMGALESVTVPGAGGIPVQMWILKPPGFDPARKWPLVFWVHGGPQSAFLDAWSYRWNAQLWAAQGYVLALPNPRGSTGFGQKFTDEISGDWNGKVVEDLMACLGWLEAQPFVDRQRMAAAGASFGGYMMNWFLGHTDKFRALVTHCGVYNFETMYGTTEELWFDEWDHGIPWENPKFNEGSPHRFAKNFKTPTLVIHNELDFRVPIAQGMDLFTALQRRGIPSKFLCFPDEGHWVLKPQNSELWNRTVFEWLSEHLKRP